MESTAEKERAFEKAADATLHQLEDAIGALGLDVEVELQMGILSLEFGDGVKFIINSHRAARQIWMAADRTAWHFDPSADGAWVATKTGEHLRPTIAAVLSKKLNKPVSL